MGAPEKLAASNTSSMQVVCHLLMYFGYFSFCCRVKVYRLNDDGKWDDQGTGHVTIDYFERSEDLSLFVIDEEDNETLLVHRICSDDIYRKQEDTIISWRDVEYSSELALSFQETTGCSYIWDNICNVQRNLHFSTIRNETYHGTNNELRELPAVELSTLPKILKVVVDSSVTDQLCVTELILHEQNFFPKLMDLFRVCEDLENKEGLHMIYKIVKGIILLNSPQIFEKIFGDDLIMDIIGCLEYDLETPHVNHRNILKEHVVFKEAIPIKDNLTLSKIHQTYRIGYLKDAVLPRVLDEATIASLNSMIHSNNGMVVTLLKDDPTFIKELFAKLKSPTTSPDSKRNSVFFLQEFCSLIKSLQMVQQLRLFRDLVNEDLYGVITNILQSDDKKLVLTGTDILMFSVNQDPAMLRSYVSRKEGVPLLGLLVKGMLTDFGNDMHCQFLEIIRSLLDSFSSAGQREAIVEIFYERHLDQLINVITSSCKNINGNHGSQTSAKPEILLNICDLLCFCVLHHPYRIKCNFLLNGVLDKVLYLTRRREKYLVVAAVRFIRTLISHNDEHLASYIAKNNVFRPIIDAFVSNGNRYNLLNSAVLELFEHIRKENLKILLKYLVETFWDRLVKFDSLPSIQSLKVRYDQTQKEEDSRRRVEERVLEKEEEDYFNKDSDEEDSASASTPRTTQIRAKPVSSSGTDASSPSLRVGGGLVDYEDDDDDEDYKPPPKKESEKLEEDEKSLEFRLKRKLMAAKEDPNLVKKHRLVGKNPKSKESLFATLCSTLSHAALPSKKPTSSTPAIDETPGHEKNGVVSPSENSNRTSKIPEEKGVTGT
ncbi:putative armadillo-like helical, PH-like domain superfamily protein [Helianthus annuus]|nr:putative armadillo-like helical, PH-like domain superfamily protein [Helianthus annuus]KAJ0638959.1 putative armadillo-like helical, PH-like domain superfamily protein [Helianthus annuus]KAJ0784971.1 putative armadillo-like helical, PH-like domain superfamily protein [Helianthus annuus]KAJ0958881.1 putative armadillo-like helical, PH-like domain superfamily protein [Helianthus annuus]